MLNLRARYLVMILLPVFLALAYVIEGVEFESGTLILLAAGLILFVVLASHLASAQKRRIARMHTAIRSEADSLFSVLVQTRKLPEQSREKIQDLVAEYMGASFRQRRPAEGENEYDHLVTYCLEYQGKDPETIEKILGILSANQANRTKLSVRLGECVSGSEWFLVLVLLGLSLGFVLTLNTVNPAGQVVQALLSTGLVLEAFYLLKLSYLTNKTARNIWQPLHTLNTTRFRRLG